MSKYRKCPNCDEDMNIETAIYSPAMRNLFCSKECAKHRELIKLADDLTVGYKSMVINPSNKVIH